MGGTTREDLKYPGILGIPDTVSVWEYLWWESLNDPKYPEILGIPDAVCVGICMDGQLEMIPSIPGYLVFRKLCL